MTTATLGPEAAALDALAAAGRAESSARARTLARVASWVSRRRAEATAESFPELGRYASVEVATALGVSTAAADVLVGQALRLRDELPRLGAALAAGDLDWPKVRTVLDRLVAVTDPDVRARVEQEVLARVVGRASTNHAVGAACDRVLAAIDPSSVRERARRAVADRSVDVFAAGDGLAGLSALLPGPDGRLVDAVLEQMCADPCSLDPRTTRQRRADALVALVRGDGALRCTCGHPDCVDTVGPDDLPVPGPTGPATSAPDDTTTAPDGTAGDVDSPAPAGPGTAYSSASGQPGGAEAPDGSAVPPALRRAPLPARRVVMHVVVPVETLLGSADLPAVLRRFGVLDAGTARGLAADATWRRLLTLDGVPQQLDRARPAGRLPGAPPPLGDAPPHTPPQDDGARDAWHLDDGWFDQPCPDSPADVLDPSVLVYSPSAALAELVRDRDGHCRFPGCTVPADACELDHVVPFDHDHPHLGGWTVRTNLACLCRRHHRAKTLRLWTARMAPDGTQHWAGPAGQSATTAPDGAPPRPGEHGPPAPAADRPESHPPPIGPPWTEDEDHARLLDHSMAATRDHRRAEPSLAEQSLGGDPPRDGPGAAHGADAKDPPPF